MTGKLQPLDQKFPVTKADGTPTDYFIRWAQQRQIDIKDALTEETLALYLAAHPLQAGSGIALAPSGNLAQSPTISAQVQAILNQISTVHGSVLFRGAADWQALGPGTAGQFLKTNGAGADPVWAAGGGGTLQAHFVDQKPNGTAGGASVAGWQTRVLNTTVTNSIPGVVLAANQITLPAGTFDISATAPAYRAGRTKSRIRNITSGTTLLVGDSDYNLSAADSAISFCRVVGRITLAGSTVIALQHFFTTTNPAIGLGVETSSGEVEIYAEILINTV